MLYIISKEPKGTSLNYLFCQTNNVKPKQIEFSITNRTKAAGEEHASKCLVF